MSHHLHRARIRLDGENVFGNKISVASPKHKLYSHNVSSPVRGSSNKDFPPSVEDSCEEVTESHSDSKGEEEEEHFDDKGPEDPLDNQAHKGTCMLVFV